jgi:hypothetical protein
MGISRGDQCKDAGGAKSTLPGVGCDVQLYNALVQPVGLALRTCPR